MEPRGMSDWDKLQYERKMHERTQDRLNEAKSTISRITSAYVLDRWDEVKQAILDYHKVNEEMRARWYSEDYEGNPS